MTYSLIIRKGQYNDPAYVNGIKTWTEVIQYLKHKLDQWTTSVHIYKYSSNDRLLGEKRVTMSNLCEVAYSLTDKILL